MKACRYISFVVFFGIAGCMTDSGESLPDPIPVSAYLIESAQISARTVTLEVVCSVPEPCWAFARTEQARSGNSYFVTVYARRTTNDPCLQVLSSINASFSTTVEAPGSYTFAFWRYDGTTLDTVLTIR